MLNAWRHIVSQGGPGQRIEPEGPELVNNAQDVDLIGLDAALSRLAQVDSVKARIVDLRHLAGMSIEETAEAVAHVPATVKRQWQAARVWLFHAPGAVDVKPD